MSSMLPPNATVGERALEGATARISDVPVLVRESWDPDTCPVALLPWLAWAYSVDEWDPSWSEGTKRQAVKDAFKLNRLKGTVWAIKRQFALLGYPSAILDEGAAIRGEMVDAVIPYGAATGEFERLAGDGNGKWLAQGGTTLRWFASVSDGMRFTPATAPDVDVVNAMKFIGGFWWIVGSTAGSPRVIRASISDAGDVTYSAALAPSEVPTNIAASSTNFVLVCAAHFFSTADPMAVAWMQGSASAPMYTDVYDRFRYEGGRFIATDGSNLYVSTDDGATFAKHTSAAIGETPIGIAATSSRIAIFGVAGAIKTSDDDGVTWISRTSPTTHVFRTGGVVGGAFVSTTGNGYVVTSPDGASWTLVSLDGVSDLSGLSTLGAIAVVSDSDDYSANFWISTDAGASWTLKTAPWTGPNFLTVAAAIAGETLIVGGKDNTNTPKLSRYILSRFNDAVASWAHYRMRLAQLITAAEGARIAAKLEQYAPKRSQLWSINFAPHAILYDGTYLADGTYTHGEYV